MFVIITFPPQCNYFSIQILLHIFYPYILDIDDKGNLIQINENEEPEVNEFNFVYFKCLIKHTCTHIQFIIFTHTSYFWP